MKIYKPTELFELPKLQKLDPPIFLCNPNCIHDYIVWEHNKS